MSFSTWTPLSFVAEKLLQWTEDVTSRPKTGSVIKMVTKGGETEIILC